MRFTVDLEVLNVKNLSELAPEELDVFFAVWQNSAESCLHVSRLCQFQKAKVEHVIKNRVSENERRKTYQERMNKNVD